MTQVPTAEDFFALQKRVDELERKLDILLHHKPDWFDVKQTMEALRVSRGTVHRLTKIGKLNPRYEGKKPLYEVSQILAYIQSTRVSLEAADSRILAARRKSKS
ncbi:helix-turn-helix domain-containing protein [Spirosoma koreense]